MIFCVTFPARFRTDPHPTLPNAHPDGWMEIEAEDIVEAREIALWALGNGWESVHMERYFLAADFPLGCLGTIEAPQVRPAPADGTGGETRPSPQGPVDDEPRCLWDCGQRVQIYGDVCSACQDDDDAEFRAVRGW